MFRLRVLGSCSRLLGFGALELSSKFRAKSFEKLWVHGLGSGGLGFRVQGLGV